MLNLDNIIPIPQLVKEKVLSYYDQEQWHRKVKMLHTEYRATVLFCDVDYGISNSFEIELHWVDRYRPHKRERFRICTIKVMVCPDTRKVSCYLG